MKKILIATPIFPPDLGGPATYAENLARELSAKGHKVTVLTYSRPRSSSSRDVFRLSKVPSFFPSGIKHLVYFFKAIRFIAKSDAVLVFDPFIVGVPVVMANYFFQRPLIMRVEGDFLWEMYSMRTRSEIALTDFWSKFETLKLNRKEKAIYRLSNWVFGRANFLVFSTSFR